VSTISLPLDNFEAGSSLAENGNHQNRLTHRAVKQSKTDNNMNTKNIASTLKETGTIILASVLIFSTILLAACGKKDETTKTQLEILEKIHAQEIRAADNKLELEKAHLKYGEPAPVIETPKVLVPAPAAVIKAPTPQPVAEAPKAPVPVVTIPATPVAPASPSLPGLPDLPAKSLTTLLQEGGKQ
jgi:hypothetical protein